MKAMHFEPDDPLYQEILHINEVIERVKVLLDAGYVTVKGALFIILLDLKEREIKKFYPKELIEILGISRSTFYRAKREIEEQEGWRIRRQRGILLRVTRKSEEE